MLKTTEKRAEGVSHWKRLGKIKLGTTRVSNKLKCKETHQHVEACFYRYPVDVKHFVMDPKWEQLLGKEPQELEIMLAFPTLVQNFDTRAAVYRASGGKFCHTTDDVTAMRQTEFSVADPKNLGKFKKIFKPMPIDCPNLECEYRKKGECKERGYFEFMIPKCKEIGTFFLVMGTRVGIDQITATMKALEGFCAARPNGMHGIRLVLRREKVIFNRDVAGDGVLAKVEKWIPKLEIDFKSLLQPDQQLLGPMMGQTVALQAPTEILSGSGEDDEEDKDDTPPSQA